MFISPRSELEGPKDCLVWNIMGWLKSNVLRMRTRYIHLCSKKENMLVHSLKSYSKDGVNKCTERCLCHETKRKELLSGRVMRYEQGCTLKSKLYMEIWFRKYMMHFVRYVGRKWSPVWWYNNDTRRSSREWWVSKTCLVRVAPRPACTTQIAP